MNPSIRQTFLFPVCIIISGFLFSCQKESFKEKSAFDVAEPESRGISADSLMRVRQFLQNAVDDQWISGAVAMLSIDGDIVFEEAFGFNNIAQKDSMETPDIFRIASMTKPITTLAVLQLYEAGKLDFDDPVSKFIPEFADPRILDSFNPEDSTYTTKPAAKEITLHHLLTHTSGIAYSFSDTVLNILYGKAGIIELTTLEPVSLEENIAKLAQIPLVHEPGERWTYGLSIDVLGRVIEVASGMPFDRYLKENIFDPLEMDDTGFYFDSTNADRLTTMYSNHPEENLVPFQVDPTLGITADYPVQGAKTYFSGGGGLNSTARDYLKFSQMLLNGGEFNGTRLVKEETLSHIRENRIGELRLGSDYFSYGFAVTAPDGDLKRRKKPGRLSWGGAFQTTFWIDQERNAIVILLTQTFPSHHQEQLYEGFEQGINNSYKED